MPVQLLRSAAECRAQSRKMRRERGQPRPAPLSACFANSSFEMPCGQGSRQGCPRSFLKAGAVFADRKVAFGRSSPRPGNRVLIGQLKIPGARAAQPHSATNKTAAFSSVGIRNSPKRTGRSQPRVRLTSSCYYRPILIGPSG